MDISFVFQSCSLFSFAEAFNVFPPSRKLNSALVSDVFVLCIIRFALSGVGQATFSQTSSPLKVVTIIDALYAVAAVAIAIGRIKSIAGNHEAHKYYCGQNFNQFYSHHCQSYCSMSQIISFAFWIFLSDLSMLRSFSSKICFTTDAATESPRRIYTKPFEWLWRDNKIIRFSVFIRLRDNFPMK